MIHGRRGAPAHPLRAAAATLAAGAALAVCPVPSAAAAPAPGRGSPALSEDAVRASSPWVRAWSWRPATQARPSGCAPYSGGSGAGPRWSPSLVTVEHGTLRLGTTPATGTRRSVGSGVGCSGRAQRYGRVQVRARIPAGSGVVGRIALWPSSPSRGSDWSGLTVPAADVSPAYATNGCGDHANGAALPAGLAGAFHTYDISWSPTGFTLVVDGRVLYRDQESFDGPRWLGVSLAPTTASTARSAQLLVAEVVAYRWAAKVPPASSPQAPGSPPSTLPGPGGAVPSAGADGEGGAAPADAGETVPGGARSTAAGGTAPAGPARGGSTAGGPAAGRTAAGDAVGGVAVGDAFVSALGGTPLGTPWLIGGGCVAVGVLVGVVRAALAARRRPLAPR